VQHLIIPAAFCNHIRVNKVTTECSWAEECVILILTLGGLEGVLSFKVSRGETERMISEPPYKNPPRNLPCECGDFIIQGY
jgi:hypothetical protein